MFGHYVPDIMALSKWQACRTPIKNNFNVLLVRFLLPFGKKKYSWLCNLSLRLGKRSTDFQIQKGPFRIRFLLLILHHSVPCGSCTPHSLYQPQHCRKESKGVHLKPTFLTSVNKHFLYLPTTLLKSHLTMRPFYK